MELSLLLAFAGTFFLVSVSPGLCMTLSMSLGIRIGVKRTLWMMLGELAGVALVAVCAILGVAAILLGAPKLFSLFKGLGAAYLFYMGWQAWISPATQFDQLSSERTSSSFSLISQGFFTAVSNPKAWAFFAALLPPFVDQTQPLPQQLMVLLGLILAIEFVCLLIYAQGGRALNELLHKQGKARWLNRISGGLLFFVGAWLLLG